MSLFGANVSGLHSQWCSENVRANGSDGWVRRIRAGSAGFFQPRWKKSAGLFPSPCRADQRQRREPRDGVASPWAFWRGCHRAWPSPSVAAGRPCPGAGSREGCVTIPSSRRSAGGAGAGPRDAPRCPAQPLSGQAGDGHAPRQTLGVPFCGAGQDAFLSSLGQPFPLGQTGEYYKPCLFSSPSPSYGHRNQAAEQGGSSPSCKEVPQGRVKSITTEVTGPVLTSVSNSHN